MAVSHESIGAPPPNDNSTSVGANSRPQSPSEFSNNLLERLGKAPKPAEKESQNEAGAASTERSTVNDTSQLSPSQRSKRRLLKGISAGLGVALLGGIGAIFSRQPSSPTVDASGAVPSKEKPESEKYYDLVTGAARVIFNGEVIHPLAQKFSQPDGLTPQGDPRWTLDTQLTNPNKPATNQQVQSPKLFVTFKGSPESPTKIDAVNMNTNIAQLFPEFSNPQGVQEADFKKVIFTLCKNAPDYATNFKERRGGGDDGAGDDFGSSMTATRQINGSMIEIKINAIGNLTFNIPANAIQNS